MQSVRPLTKDGFPVEIDVTTQLWWIENDAVHELVGVIFFDQRWLVKENKHNSKVAIYNCYMRPENAYRRLALELNEQLGKVEFALEEALRKAERYERFRPSGGGAQ